MSNRNADETEGLASTAPYFQPLHNGPYHEPPSQSLTSAIAAEYRASQHLAHESPAYNDGQDDAAGGAEAVRDSSGQVDQGDAEGQSVTNAELARLLEAVKSGTNQGDSLSVQTGEDEYHGIPFQPQSSTLGKRKRAEDSTTDNANKRSKDAIDPTTDPSLPFTPQQQQYSQPTVAAARAAGVHSAVALFRSPSASAAKKYTRPPMSKLYGSLHLTPENFLHLQAAAKTYMLDTNHPDRQECVGVRGQTSVDMAKLRLFNCVKEFLEEGVGERFFPEHTSESSRGDQTTDDDRMSTDGPGFGDEDGKRWVWPRDAESIISLVTPLMRRMVTNERQRMYAAESRKGGSSAKKGTPTPGHGDENDHDISMHNGAFAPEQVRVVCSLGTTCLYQGRSSTFSIHLFNDHLQIRRLQHLTVDPLAHPDQCQTSSCKTIPWSRLNSAFQLPHHHFHRNWLRT